MPLGTRCPDCGGTNLRKETDILDVWFDSGSSHLAVLGHRADVPWPSDVYLEGGDQYRGWFHSSLLIGVGIRGRAPYRQVLTHGWTLDAEGRAMSKSLGNTVEPQEVIKTHGAEILRLWVASVDFREDVVLTSEILTRLSEAYRKLRNTLRWCVSNLYDFEPQQDWVTGEQREEIDAWALERTAQVLEQVDKGYNDFAFHKVYRALYDFATIDLSAFYFDIVKDRLYTAPAKSIRRRAGQTTLCLIADALVRALAPILCFTADEVWSLLPTSEGREPSVHLATFAAPAQLREGISEGHLQRLVNWERLVAVRNEVLKALEIARQEKLIGGGLEAKVRLSVNGDLASLLNEYRDSLPALFIVSQVELGRDSLEGTRQSQLPGLAVRVEKATGEKCPRCWNYSERVGEDPRHPAVCERCSAALEEIESVP